MNEGGPATGGGGRGGATSYEFGGGRQRFSVELRPGETTIVSWKKLLKDTTNNNISNNTAPASAVASAVAASKPNGAGSATGLCPDLNAPPSSSHHSPTATSHPPRPGLEARLAPGQGQGHAGENGETDAVQPPSNRLNTVIERIERLYVGRASSDEEDRNDVVPDDDEYDTEDSFIDDTELDEYFQVDNSAIKHDGFFVNRGKLERVEPSMLPNEQPKKRRRKDLGKSLDGSDDGQNPTKHVKAGTKSGKPIPLVGKNASGLSTVIALPNVHVEDVKVYNQANYLETSSRKKYIDAKGGGQRRDEMAPGKDFDQQKSENYLVNNHGSKMKEGSEFSDASNQRSQEKSFYSQNNYQSGKSLSNAGLDQSVLQKEKTGIRERPEVSSAESKNPMHNVKVPIQKKESASVRPKSTLLEKAIRDLEKLVAESRPPTADIQEADNSSQGIKRRLPPEIKQKLAKVARFAQASHGKISKELINRLMSIVGHLIQLRTLKRNLKIMVNMGLSAKQEKDSRVQLVKKEVADMIMTRIPLMRSKALEQQAGTSDDFQEISSEEKEDLKRKYSMDDTLEDKICDLYDLYVEGLEEDAGPQVRKLYAELTALWPNGFMDNHGIKRAICRAKDRRRALHGRHKDPEKIKRKKMLVRKSEAVRVEAHSLAQPVYTQQKLVADSSDHGTILVNRSASSKSVAGSSRRIPVSLLVRMWKRSSPGNSSDTRASETLQAKKMKRKPEIELGDAGQFLREKLPSVEGDDKNKSQNVQLSAAVVKSNPQPTPPSNFEQNLSNRDRYTVGVRL